MGAARPARRPGHPSDHAATDRPLPGRLVPPRGLRRAGEAKLAATRAGTALWAGRTWPYNAGMAQAAGHDDRALRRRVTRLEAIVLELAAASRPSLVPRLMGNEPGSSSADVSLEQLPSGRWVAWGGSAVAAGATRAEALSSLGRLLDEHPTIPDEAMAAGQAIAAELGLG